MKRTALLAALLLLAGCSRTAAPPAPPASIQDIMATMVDPAADALWEAVSSEVSQDGARDVQPKTDAEWQAVRRHAATLAEAGKLLAAGPRPVTHGGKQVEDAHVEGVLPATGIEQAIRAGGNGFTVRAVELQEAAGRALAAIDGRNPGKLLAAGAAIDQACERCHQAYWYPNAQQPKWPAPLAGGGRP